MDYRDIVPFIFWPWLAFSCYVLIKRSRAKRALREEDLGQPDPLLRPTGSGALVQPDPDATAPPGTAAPGGSTRTEVPPPLAPLPPNVALSGGQSIFDAPSVPEPTRSRRPIAEMVEGIRLPCNLTPLVDTEKPVGARQVVAFVTRGFSAQDVGQQVGEELRRLGFELTPRHATEVVATRGDDWLAVAVHEGAGAVSRGGRPAFPGAGALGVVVELWTE